MTFCACALPPPPPLPASLQVRVCSCSLARRRCRSFRLVDPTAEDQDGSVEPRRVETGDRGAGEGGNGFVSRLGVALTPFLCSWWGPARPSACYQVKLVFLISKVRGGLRPWKTAQKLAFGLPVDVHFSSQRKKLIPLPVPSVALVGFYRRSRLNSRSFRSGTNILTLLGPPFLQQNSFLRSRKGDSGSRSL